MLFVWLFGMTLVKQKVVRKLFFVRTILDSLYCCSFVHKTVLWSRKQNLSVHHCASVQLKMFEEVFSDELNLKSLLNSALVGDNVLESRQLENIHHVEVSVISTTSYGCESTMLFDCMCTFNDQSKGTFMLLKTFDYDNIARDIGACAKLDYKKQWQEHRAFRHPVRLLVLNCGMFTGYSAHDCSVEVNVRLSYSGFSQKLLPVEFSVHDVACDAVCLRRLDSCRNDFQRWCQLMLYFNEHNINDLPAEFYNEPFKRAIEMCAQSSEALLPTVQRNEEQEIKYMEYEVKRIVVLLDLS